MQHLGTNQLKKRNIMNWKQVQVRIIQNQRIRTIVLLWSNHLRSTHLVQRILNFSLFCRRSFVFVSSSRSLLSNSILMTTIFSPIRLSNSVSQSTMDLAWFKVDFFSSSSNLLRAASSFSIGVVLEGSWLVLFSNEFSVPVD